MKLKSVAEIGLKITRAQREYYRYTGASAQLELRGAGSSRASATWVRRTKEQSPPARNPSTHPGTGHR